jgi:hypothetical protein
VIDPLTFINMAASLEHYVSSQAIPEEGAMNSIRSRENAPAIPGGNIVRLRPYQCKAARQRRWAWWAALLFYPGPQNTARAQHAVGTGEVVKFRRQAGAARW